jgi:hypothetical protein
MHKEIMAITFVCVERFFDDSSNFLSSPFYLNRAKAAFAKDGTGAATIGKSRKIFEVAIAPFASTD